MYFDVYFKVFQNAKQSKVHVKVQNKEEVRYAASALSAVKHLPKVVRRAASDAPFKAFETEPPRLRPALRPECLHASRNVDGLHSLLLKLLTLAFSQLAFSQVSFEHFCVAQCVVQRINLK